MKKIFKLSSIILFSIITILTSCNKHANQPSTSSFNYDHIGGDETESARYELESSGTLATESLTLPSGELLYFVVNPQKLPTANALNTATRIYKMDIDTFHTTRVYQQGIECILYTPDFYFATTTATNEYEEVVATYDDEKKQYVVQDILTTGNAYIPLNGVVLAIPKQNPEKNITIQNPFTIGSEIQFSLGFNISRYPYGLVNQEMIRIPFNDSNKYRSDGEVILYSEEYGSFTKTNPYGAEIYAKYDFNNNQYYISGFRGFQKNVGDLVEDHMTYGSKIPEDGFVISAHQGANCFEGYRQGRKFAIGDIVTLENYAIYHQNQDVAFPKNPRENTMYRDETQINVIYSDSSILDEYGYTNYGLWSALELAVVKIGEYGLVTAIAREVGCPKDGYILSTQGKTATKLKEVVHLGSLIKIEGSMIHVLDQMGLNQVVQIEYYHRKLQSRLDEGKANLYDYDYKNLEAKLNAITKAQEQISVLKNEISQTNDVTLIQTNSIKIYGIMNQATTDYQLGYVAGTESSYVDGRAAWIYGTRTKSLQEVKELISHYKASNINLIYFCFFDGTTYFKSDMVPYNTNYVGDFGEYGTNNFLGAFIGEAHKAGIQVHGWTTNFHVGKIGETNTLFNAHPTWQQVYYDGRVDSDDEMTEQTLLYFDQANPEVQDFLINFYKETLNKFDFDGLHLDYIRYAAGNDVGHPNSAYCKINPGSQLYAENCLNRTQGYTEYAMNDFKRQYNLAANVNVKDYVKDVSHYKQWSEYRTSKITNFVSRIYNEVTKPNHTTLSMAIVPEVEFAKANKMQDWTTWIKNGWIDMVNGMYYSSDPNRTLVEMKKVEDLLVNNVFNYPGILAASYYSLPAIDNIYYYEAAHVASNNMGAAIFDANAIWSRQRIIYSNSNTDLETLLKKGTHRNKAVLPHDKLTKVISSFINNIKDRCNAVYIPNKAMSKSQRDKLINRLKQIPTDNAEKAALNLIALKNKLSSYGNDVAIARISEYIDMIISICNTKIVRDMKN